MTLKQQIEAYIKKKANASSISRAKGYKPVFSGLEHKVLSFTCKGSGSTPYVQSVDFSENNVNRIKVRCNCPYDNGGICKHSVSALRTFAIIMGELPDVTQPMKHSHTQNPTKQKKNKQPLVYPLADSNSGKLIDFDSIFEDFALHGYRTSYWERFDCRLTDFQDHKQLQTETTSRHHEAYQQTFTLTDEGASVSLVCSCTHNDPRKSSHCIHLLSALDFLASNMGEHCLQENFLLNNANLVLKEFGLNTEDDYQDFFEFIIDEQGFHAIQKIDNLVPITINPVTDLPTLLPSHVHAQQSSEFGMGIVLEFNGRDFCDMEIIEGKYNKARTQLANKFQRISHHNFEEHFYNHHHSNFDKQVYELVRKFDYLTSHSYDADRNEGIMQAVHTFAQISKLLEKHTQTGNNPYPVFAHKVRDTYTNRNLHAVQFNHEDKVSLLFQLSEDEHFYHLTAKVKIGDKTVQTNSSQLNINPFFIRRGDEILPLINPQLSADLMRYVEMPKTSYLKQGNEQFIENILLPLSKHYQITGKLIKTAKTNKPTAKKTSHKTNKKDSEQKDNKTTQTQDKNTQAVTSQLLGDGVSLKPQVYISESDGLVFFRLAVQYPEKMLDPHSSELRLQINDKGEFEQLPRDSEFEQDFIQLFRGLHPDFSPLPMGEAEGGLDNQPTHHIDEDMIDDLADDYPELGIYVLQPHQLIEDFWLLDTAKILQENGVEIHGFKELKSFNYNLNKPTLSMSLKSDIDWFDVELDISFGEQKVSLKDLQKAFVKKQDFVELGDGTIGMLPEKWVAQFAQYFKVGTVKKDKIQISNYQFGVIDELYEQMEDKPQFLVDLYERKQRLQRLHLHPENTVATPEGIQAELRPYQLHGLQWMQFLHENQLGGCLADDMGLGKTLQTITFLQYLKLLEREQREQVVNNSKNTPSQPPPSQGEEQHNGNSPSIIVAPTSLIFNWQNEIEKFCPTLKVLDFTGAKRKEGLDNGVDGFAKFVADYDVVLTTYGSLVNDIETLKDYEFNYAILDESQAIKNPQSQRYKAVRLIKSSNRLILTGTPIENNTFDLYAQFNFLNPGLLGNTTNFRKQFAEAIDKNKDLKTSELLAKLVNPFMLRRTKEQVATELPPKIESVMYCEMGKNQRKVYDAMKQQYRDYLLGTIEEKGINQSQMYILEGLMKLRQICNSPAILSGDADYGDDSVKLEMLTENIKEKTGKHKILVFSTFVKMLKLIERRLQEEGIECEYLDGQTRNRQAKVDNFQNNEDVRVFLISTKAGGTGLNLTKADYVFIVDPWWNPAVENQAIDRSYRIGQTKHVMAYRMICKDSIEEKIIELQESKKGIAKSIINVDDEKKSFDVDEVKALFG